MDLLNAAKSPRTIRFTGGAKIRLMQGESARVTDAQLAECRANPAVAAWLADGDLIEAGQGAATEAVEDGPFSGITNAKIAAALTDSGFETLEEVATTTVEDLTEIDGIGEATAGKLIDAATEAVESAE